MTVSRRRVLGLAGAVPLLGLAGVLASGDANAVPTVPAVAGPQRREVFGHSVQGRPLTALVLGPDDATRTALVVGCIHGSERAGIDIVRRLERIVPPADAQLWLVEAVNPDGALLHTRQNARGVDLNRNFPTGWHPNGVRGGTYYPGPRALSEPESKATAALIERIKPDLTFWYHQHLDVIDLSGGDPSVSRRYAQRVGMRVEQLSRYGGSVATWQNTRFRPATSVVLELPALVPAALVVRHAAAIRAAVTDLPTPTTVPTAAPPTGAPTARPTTADPSATPSGAATPSSTATAGPPPSES